MLQWHESAERFARSYEVFGDDLGKKLEMLTEFQEWVSELAENDNLRAIFDPDCPPQSHHESAVELLRRLTRAKELLTEARQTYHAIAAQMSQWAAESKAQATSGDQ